MSSCIIWLHLKRRRTIQGIVMKKIIPMLLGGLLVASTGIVIAAPKNIPHQLFEKIIRCKASLKEVQELNRQLDQKKIPFPESKTVSVWGGKAWDVNPPISYGNVMSDVVVMSDRKSLYLRVQAKGNLRAEMRSVAQNMNVPAQSSDPDTSYLTETSPGRTHIQWSDEKGVYWVGCTYEDPSKPW